MKEIIISAINSILVSVIGSILALIIDSFIKKYLSKLMAPYFKIRKLLVFTSYSMLFLYLLLLFIFGFPELRSYVPIIIMLIIFIIIFSRPYSQIGKKLVVSNADRNAVTKEFTVNKLICPLKSQKLILDWSTFGKGIERLKELILHYSPAVHPDIYIGVNETGLVMATFIAGSSGRGKIGYIKTGGRDKSGAPVILYEDSILPDISPVRLVAIFDFEIKSGASIKTLKQFIREKYKYPQIFYVVMGASTAKENLEIKNVSELSANVTDEERPQLFCYVMPKIGIEPPLTLR